ncbi:ClpP/crotonase-like domain-containing protein [Microdochium bolleyi]|uniref:ClpP/crotonase-like domain-containing protein n=1 Tax=Microdochium bolleyi TaxID=196109 RepID=A0A136IRM4_9PEZI|nr:ClpP/crotonase-like domain-containing protein [Microdochium bolleyi]
MPSSGTGSSSFNTPPPPTRHCILSSPGPGILLVLLNNPQKANCLNAEANRELDAVFTWFDHEPACIVAVISGAGKTFCAGADLKEWMVNQSRGIPLRLPESGFGGLSQRHGKKPVIAAVNGAAHGGGCEMVVNCDIVVASSRATFCLPEVKRGVTALAGALPRLVKTVGRQRAAEIALTGRTFTAQEFKDWGICNAVVDGDHSVLDKALEYAAMIAGASPDATIVTREGLKLGWESLSVADASRVFREGWATRIYEGENITEGLKAFAEKRQPRWKRGRL